MATRIEALAAAVSLEKSLIKHSCPPPVATMTAAAFYARIIRKVNIREEVTA